MRYSVGVWVGGGGSQGTDGDCEALLSLEPRRENTLDTSGCIFGFRVLRSEISSYMSWSHFMHPMLL